MDKPVIAHLFECPKCLLTLEADVFRGKEMIGSMVPRINKCKCGYTGLDRVARAVTMKELSQKLQMAVKSHFIMRNDG